MKRNGMMLLICLVAGVMISFSVSGAEEVPETGVLREIKERGVLRVGTAGDYQPMSYLDPETNEYVGFDAELAEEGE